jgi:hypothetical protein
MKKVTLLHNGLIFNFMLKKNVTEHFGHFLDIWTFMFRRVFNAWLVTIKFQEIKMS